jgi:monoamine oxidase
MSADMNDRPNAGRRATLFGLPAMALGGAIAAGSGDAARAQSASGSAPEEAEIIVAGAGLSGLTAARRLQEAGRRVLVLEWRDRVGGRTLYANVGDHKLDLGGQFIGPTQTAARALIAELGLKLEPVFTDAQRIWELAGARLEFGNGTPPLPFATLFDLPHVMGLIDGLAAEAGPEAPWSHPRAAELDAMTVADWMNKHAFTQNTIDLMTCSTRAVFGCEPGEISMLFLANYTAQGDSLAMLTNTKGGAQDAIIVGGAQQMSTRLAAMLGDRVRLGDAVSSVSQTADSVVVTTVGGKRYRAAHLVIAMPPGAANRIECDPVLTPARRDLQARAPMGRYYKVMVTYDRPFWRDAGFSGEVASVRGPIIAAYDDQPADGNAALLGFIGGDAATRWGNLNPDAQRQAVLDCLARWFGDAARAPLGYGFHDWTADFRQGGAPVMVLPPGALSRVGPALRAPCGRIHFAGTEAATKWTGYMDGAIRAGDAAAQAILAL